MRRISALNIDEFLIGMVLFSLPISIRINSVITIIAATYFLIKMVKNRAFKYLLVFYVSISFFLAQFISYVISNDHQKAEVKLVLYSTFLLFPIMFSYLSFKKIKLNEGRVFKYLFYGVVVILIYGIMRFLYDIIFLSERYDYGRAVALLLKYIPHHAYMSMLILISIYATIMDRLERNRNGREIFIVPILYLFLILLSSRMAILTGVVILPMFLFFKIRKKGYKKKFIWTGLFALVILIAIGFTNDFVRDKILYSYYEIMDIATKDKPFFGVSFRQKVWGTAYTLITESPLWGYGIGDIQEILNTNYSDKEVVGLNAHNQYLQLALHHGVFIFLILIILLAKVIKKCLDNKRNLILFSWTVILFFCLTESILNRQWGVVLFAFVLNYSIYLNKIALKNQKI
ncbi:O-antigen ligase family protein [Flavobacteriaceae bacterium S356]|uniref:O-antigen ligase family protein n=1 Tax=Asprobacillus argus TaxID=3076534 RepID=A0ABU3LBL3_9FLAO|nr:O-antigen ligase family protein [Flavobacteriaceae bacterium S356]